jgi:hypothetical protein
MILLLKLSELKPRLKRSTTTLVLNGVCGSEKHDFFGVFQKGAFVE